MIILGQTATFLFKYFARSFIIADDYFGSNRNQNDIKEIFEEIIADDYFGSNRNFPSTIQNIRVIIADDYFGSNRN